MIPKKARLRRTEGILLLAAGGLVIALYLASSKTNEKAPPEKSADSQTLEQSNTTPPQDISPASAPNTPKSATPLELLLNHPHRRSGGQSSNTLAPIDAQFPARAAETPAEMPASGPPNTVDAAKPQNLATEKGPPGLPVNEKILSRSSAALRNNTP
jgi:hypothetical protein